MIDMMVSFQFCIGLKFICVFVCFVFFIVFEFKLQKDKYHLVEFADPILTKYSIGGEKKEFLQSVFHKLCMFFLYKLYNMQSSQNVVFTYY